MNSLWLISPAVISFLAVMLREAAYVSGELFMDSDDYFMMAQLMRSAGCNHAGGHAPASSQRLAAASSSGSGGGGGGGLMGNALGNALLVDKVMDLKALPARENPGSPDFVNSPNSPEVNMGAAGRSEILSEPSHNVEIIAAHSSNSTGNATIEFSPLLLENSTDDNATTTVSPVTPMLTTTVGQNVTGEMEANANTTLSSLSPAPTLSEPATIDPSGQPSQPIDFGAKSSRKALRRMGPVFSRRRRSLFNASGNGTAVQPIMNRSSWINGEINNNAENSPKSGDTRQFVIPVQPAVSAFNNVGG